MIENWVKEGPEQAEFFYACLHEWETAHPQFKADTETAIAKFNEMVLAPADYQETLGVGQNPSQSGAWQRWLIAASVLFASILGSWLLREPILQKSYRTGSAETSTILLADGSKVVLNANSLLQVPRFGFGKTSRQVHLKGEARFSVVHTPDDKTFVVSTDPTFQVEVLGTEFNLSARRGSAKVVLQKGKVKVRYREKPDQAMTSLTMAPGDFVSVNEKQKVLRVKRVPHPENYSAWQDSRFVFDQTSLAEIKEILEDNYDLVVSLKGIDVSKVTVSGSFKAKNANELLQALSEVLNISVLRQDNQVMLINRN
ncbi:FecR family protein [Hymenobacter sp. GOD-10R]|uniref:FecR family protein n=1 Tax=Hymenobacter sp. GOD-10R TaxID=3093922 RepID=UPI002D77DE02|nr:FecR domain-containing protein [Hymenobacter sp. GOD-10R]WRQ31074.1 FecR domain-containing protein [Hymenobacter sp. GOD-10R]